MSGGPDDLRGRGRRLNRGGRQELDGPEQDAPTRAVPAMNGNAGHQLREWSAVANGGTAPAPGAGPTTEKWSSAAALSRQPAAPPASDRRPVHYPAIDHHPIPRHLGGDLGSGQGVNPLIAVFSALALVALGAAGFALLTQGGNSTDSAPGATLSSSSSEAVVDDIQSLLQGIGYGDVVVEDRDGTVHVSGSVDTQADMAAVITATSSLADGTPINTDELAVGTIARADVSETETDGEGEVTGELVVAQSGLADPLQRLQVVLHRTVAAAPIIFEPATSGLSRWHSNTLDQVAAILETHPGIAITVVGYTDQSGSEAENQALSLQRAEAVKEYLVAQGIAPGTLQTEARGESEASGIRDIGYLERRVEFEVVGASVDPATVQPLDVGIIVPSGRDDRAFSQSLVDALDVLNEERGGLTIDVTENVFELDQAMEQTRQYVADGNDVVILHGAQFRPIVEELAGEFPEVVFIVGPDPLTTDLPNVFVYTVAAEQGAFVLGDLAASLSTTKTIGIVGPIPAPEPVRFVEGFRQGAEGGGAEVLVEYTGSFSDSEAAAEIAQAHVAAGADVLTGTSQLTVGPIGVAEDEGLLWFANQANQTDMAPGAVVASQVYHFEVAIREIMAEIDADSTSGGTFPLTLGNGGMLLEFNPDYGLGRDLRFRADDLLLGVAAGSINVEVDVEE